MPEPFRILVTDDREQNRYVLRRILEGAGYSCEEASTGRDALERVQSLPDLVILDVNLPDISGTQVCREIKQDSRTAQVSVLQISAAFVSDVDKAKALDAGADGYLTHPIEPVVLLSTVRSLLRLRRAEMAARAAAVSWQSTFDSLQEGLAVLDADGNIAQVNRAFEEMCQKNGGCRIGEPAGNVFEALLGTREPLLSTEARRFTAEYQVRDDRTVQITVDALSVPGTSAGKIVVITDITDRKVADYALRTTEKLAESGRVAQSLAHEINNPLEAITNLLYLAESAATRENVKQFLSLANEELSRISRITKQSLSFHRDTLQPVPVDVGQIVREVVDVYGTIAADRSVKIVFHQRPSLSIMAFPGQLRQVFGNLVRNAAEAAAPHTEVIVRVRSCRRSGGEGTRITIHDRGAGIPGNIRKKLFDPFFTTKELKGSGLGLWVSKAIISDHHGTLRFRSRTLNGLSGTTFEVFLPIKGIDTRCSESTVHEMESPKNSSHAETRSGREDGSSVPVASQAQQVLRKA